MFEGQKARGGNDANLAHSAAEHFAVNAGALDKFARAEDHRAERRPKAFGKAEHDGVDLLGHVGYVVAERGGGVEDARPIQVHFQAEGAGAIADFVDARSGIDRAAGHVAGIFQADKGRLRVVINLGPNRSLDLLPRKDAVVTTANGARHATRDRRHRGELVKIDVAALFAENFVAMMRPDFDGDQVAHAAGGNKESRFLPKNFRGAFLELVDGG